MKKLSHAEIAAHRVPLNNIDSARRVPLTVMVDNVRSLYNVGSIFRTSDGAMIEKLILTGFTPYPPRKEIDKTALGATKTIPWEYCKDPLPAIQKLKNAGYTVCCLELTDTSIPYYEFSTGEVIGPDRLALPQTSLVSLGSCCTYTLDVPGYAFALRQSS